MSVSIDSTPHSFQSAYIPIEYTVSSDKTVALTEASCAVSDSGGKALFTKASHGFVVGDVIAITPSDSSATWLNTKTVITVVATNTFKTDLDFSSTPSPNTNSCVRTNLNFKIKAEVTVGGSVVGSISQRIVGSDFIFDVSQILQTQFSLTLPTISGSPALNTDATSIKAYTVEFIETYDNEEGLYEEYDTDTSVTRYAINSTLQYLEEQNMSDFLIKSTASTTARFLTNIPDSQKIQSTEAVTVYFIISGSATVTLTGSKDGGSAVGFGSQAYTNQMGYFEYSGFSGVTSYIDLWLANGATQISEKIRIYKDTKCYSNTKRFAWLNRLGGIDMFTFKFDFNRVESSKKATYESQLDSGYSVGDRGTITIENQTQDTATIKSEYLTNEQHEWIAELFSSPDVYIYDTDNDEYTPVSGIQQSTPVHADDYVQKQIKYNYPKIIIQRN